VQGPPPTTGAVPEDVRARILLATNLAPRTRRGREHSAPADRRRPSPGDPNTLYNAACTYAVLGKKAEALETLKKAFAAGYSNGDWAAKDSDLDCLHDDVNSKNSLGAAKAPRYRM